MAVAATTCSFASLVSAYTTRCYSIPAHRLHLSSVSCRSAPKAINHSNKGASSSPKKPLKLLGGEPGEDEKIRTQSSPFKSFGAQYQRKDKKGASFDLKDQQLQVETGNLQDASFLNAVVKVYCTHTAPDYSLPWQKQRQYTSTGSAFMIGGGKLLTNAHCVEHATQFSSIVNKKWERE